ncbi:hypothetical protein [Mycobacterium sp. 1245852.3]|uniref:hypothetical protein n=1 Tax=Mycobacterium sp. 1245852.3 TaxID=1856860 RepID=UPI0007FE8FE6|nr:hypothetical protein [Mycobacterium sp. 1245852.3]OBJ81112.1 hypothetical protein A9W96_29665 [Mycobacterium sp. 1245852.3]
MTAPLIPPESQVLRIPVAGPYPYNTLAYVQYLVTREDLESLTISIAPGQIVRETFRSPSPLILHGFDSKDQRQKRVEHSSTAVLTSLAASDAEPFTAAVDSIGIDAQIDDESGQVFYTFSQAKRYIYNSPFFDKQLNFVIRFSSWVLLYEPRPEDPYERDKTRNLHARVPVGPPPVKRFGDMKTP